VRTPAPKRARRWRGVSASVGTLPTSPHSTPGLWVVSPSSTPNWPVSVPMRVKPAATSASNTTWTTARPASTFWNPVSKAVGRWPR